MAQAGSGSSSKNVNNTTSYDHTVSISILGDSHFQLPIRRHPTRLTDISEDAELYQNEASVEPNPDLKYDSDSDSSQVVFTPEVGLSEDEEIEPANTERMVTEKVLQPVTENLWKFHEAIKQGDTATVNTYKDTKVFDCPESSTGYTPLVMAIVENQLDMARFLLEHGADVHQRANKLPPVVYAATRTVRAPQFMQLLLDFGAALNTISGPHQYNALHHAAVNGCIDAVNFLVCQGMDIEGTCWQGRTPLLLAAEQGHTMIVKLLLAKGAELHHRCRSGGTGLAWAVCDDHVDTIEYLLKEGNDVNDCDNAGFSKYRSYPNP
jgi:ankyrin repeat protein